MDDATTGDDETRTPGDDGDRVGLGRVIEDRRGQPTSTATDDAQPTDDTVEEASEDSFPASDPPTFMSDAATPADRDHAADEAIELPAPRDVP